jgi:hypothetical protein
MACDSTKRNELSWTFLNSEFARDLYASRPIERRLGAFLRHHQMLDVLNDGAAFDGLLNCVMANVGPALRSGILGVNAPHADDGASSGTEAWST